MNDPSTRFPAPVDMTPAPSVLQEQDEETRQGLGQGQSSVPPAAPDAPSLPPPAPYLGPVPAAVALGRSAQSAVEEYEAALRAALRDARALRAALAGPAADRQAALARCRYSLAFVTATGEDLRALWAWTEPHGRRYPRVPLRPTSITLTVHPPDGSITPDLPGELQDLGLGGIRLTSPAPLVPGTTVRLDLPLPDGGQVMGVQGEVVWARTESEERTQAGVAFVRLPRGSRAALTRALTHPHA